MCTIQQENDQFELIFHFIKSLYCFLAFQEKIVFFHSRPAKSSKYLTYILPTRKFFGPGGSRHLFCSVGLRFESHVSPICFEYYCPSLLLIVCVQYVITNSCVVRWQSYKTGMPEVLGSNPTSRMTFSVKCPENMGTSSFWRFKFQFLTFSESVIVEVRARQIPGSSTPG